MRAFPLVPKLMTFKDVEWRKDRYFALGLFRRIWQRWGQLRLRG